MRVAEKVGRNDDCPCGSGLKHKFCCGGNGELKVAPPEEKGPKILSPLGFQRCFLKLVLDAGGSIDIPCAELDNIPKDEAMAITHSPVDDVFHFKAVKVKKKSPIIQPDRRVRRPVFGGN